MSGAISADEPDWTREKPDRFWDPGKKLLRAIRGYQAWRSRGFLGKIACKIFVARYRFWSVVTGADIPLTCEIGGWTSDPAPQWHRHPSWGQDWRKLSYFSASNNRNATSGGIPTIGGHVDIGAGAKILGNVHIPPYSEVGANSVITKWEKTRQDAIK